jgi:hypothetical protein
MNETMSYVIQGTKDLTAGNYNLQTAILVLGLLFAIFYVATVLFAIENSRYKKFISKEKLLQKYDDWKRERL